jgi:hypothetical protein
MLPPMKFIPDFILFLELHGPFRAPEFSSSCYSLVHPMLLMQKSSYHAGGPKPVTCVSKFRLEEDKIFESSRANRANMIASPRNKV